jgi:hypothetical protein
MKKTFSTILPITVIFLLGYGFVLSSISKSCNASPHKRISFEARYIAKQLDSLINKETTFCVIITEDLKMEVALAEDSQDEFATFFVKLENDEILEYVCKGELLNFISNKGINFQYNDFLCY